MNDTEIFKCFSCFREWEEYSDKYALQMRKCSICLNPICLKCHADKTKKQHCGACECPREKNKEEIKRERKKRYKWNNRHKLVLKDIEPKTNPEAVHQPTGSLNIHKLNKKMENEASNSSFTVTVIPLHFNVARISTGMLSNGMDLYFSN